MNVVDIDRAVEATDDLYVSDGRIINTEVFSNGALGLSPFQTALYDTNVLGAEFLPVRSGIVRFMVRVNAVSLSPTTPSGNITDGPCRDLKP